MTALHDGLDELAARARELAATGERQMLGIVGPPGSGKSTLARQVVEAVGANAMVVPMDGFHLAQCQLERLGRTDRKGAIDTFDAGGFARLMQRLHRADEDVVYAPAFHREIEEPIAASIAVPRDIPLVVVEGNYLLVDHEPWAGIRQMLTDCWYVELDEDTRLDRLIARHMEFGRDPASAHEHAHGSDQQNAKLIATTKRRADRVIDVGGWPTPPA
ncbi:nucleoside/nucleotide kinase family protein [Georgenia subflava]|uniref:Nucleoside/nucleotide kinase family protein n=1 Tax=Georgenia subflava TaxID=1622177 RepID=A0A6N7EI12_9MICO|nr:nucleoside/nucleotide kinase family protein [Georgenia subflava]MPV38032.1 nucleoside/nucleotide kinase family protein [Georgenia subflava]